MYKRWTNLGMKFLFTVAHMTVGDIRVEKLRGIHRHILHLSPSVGTSEEEGLFAGVAIDVGQ